MPLSLLFSGDVSFTGVYETKLAAGEEIFSEALLKRFEESDFAVVNLEGPATRAPNTFRPDVSVVSPPETIPYAASCRLNVFNLANNHSFDCGVQGYVDTAAAIAEHGGLHFGAGLTLAEASKVLYLHKETVSAALIGVCHREGLTASGGSPGIFCEEDVSVLKASVAEAKERADWVILNYHGGEEFTALPMPRRRRLLRGYLGLGADIVVAHHPHVLQGYEQVGEGLVFYSLGNFVFDIPGHRSRALTDRGALLQLELTERAYSFRLIPTRMDLKEGRVEEAPGEPLDHLDLSRLKNYRSAWLADAHRTLFQNAAQERAEARRNEPRPNPPLARRLFKPGAYLRAYRLLKGRNSRPVFLAALGFAAKQKLGLAGPMDERGKPG